MILSILIPTIVGRERQCGDLTEELQGQAAACGATGNVEVLTMCDNKEMSIGVKRQALLDICKGDYCVWIDDDDAVPLYYVAEVLAALRSGPDCVGYLEQVTIGDNTSIACHSDRFEDWAQNTAGYGYVRTIFCKDVIKTSIARAVGFSDMRFGEDHDFARRLKQSGLLKNEAFINQIMYYYKREPLSPQQHKERYGL